MQSMDSYRYLIAGRLTLKRAGGSAIFNFLSVASKKGTFSGGVNAPDQTQVTFLCYIHWKTYSIICIQRCKSSASEKVIIWRSWGSGNSSRGYLELHLLHFLEEMLEKCTEGNSVFMIPWLVHVDIPIEGSAFQPEQNLTSFGVVYWHYSSECIFHSFHFHLIFFIMI